MNSLNSLPFAEMYEGFLAEASKTTQVTQARYTESAAIKHRQMVATIARGLASIHSEAGSDGDLENASEGVGDFDPDDHELSDDLKREIRYNTLTATLDNFCLDNKVSQLQSWLPYQLLAYFGAWTPVFKDNKIDARATISANAKTPLDLGITVFALGNRSKMFEKGPRQFPQYKSPIAPLVPIILAGFKKYQQIPYESWSRDGLAFAVDRALYEAMTYNVPELTTAEILTLRDIALTDTTGVRAGKPGNPATSAKLNHLVGTSIDLVPRLAKVMTLQTWCAHPANRTPYMILDPKSWDSLPAPLVDTEVAVTKATATWTAKTSNTTDMPW